MTLPDRFWVKLDKHGPNGCWLWHAALSTTGYGKYSHEGVVSQAHRVAYEDAKGPIPAGLDLDHLCRVRACVNPDHLEPVTRRVNTLRGETVAAANAVKTHCLRGHPLEGDNVYIQVSRSGHPERSCKTCRRLALEKWEAEHPGDKRIRTQRAAQRRQSTSA